MEDFECDVVVDDVLEEKMFPKHFNDKLLEIHETRPNITKVAQECVFHDEAECYPDKLTTIVPINGGGEAWDFG